MSLDFEHVPCSPKNGRFLVPHEVANRGGNLGENSVEVNGRFQGEVQGFLVVVGVHVCGVVRFVQGLVVAVRGFGKCVSATNPQVKVERKLPEEGPGDSSAEVCPVVVGAISPSHALQAEYHGLVADAGGYGEWGRAADGYPELKSPVGFGWLRLACPCFLGANVFGDAGGGEEENGEKQMSHASKVVKSPGFGGVLNHVIQRVLYQCVCLCENFFIISSNIIKPVRQKIEVRYENVS